MRDVPEKIKKIITKKTVKNKIMPEFTQPHYSKLIACLNNPRLPDSDRDRLEEAIRKYHHWIDELKLVKSGQTNTV